MVGFIKDLSVLTENKITWEEKKIKEKKKEKEEELRVFKAFGAATLHFSYLWEGSRRK